MAWSDLPRIRQMMLGTSLPCTGCSERKSPLQPARLNQALSWSARWLSVWGISFVLCRRSGSFEGEKWTFWAAQTAHKLSTRMARAAPRMVTLSYTGERKTTPTTEARRRGGKQNLWVLCGNPLQYGLKTRAGSREETPTADERGYTRMKNNTHHGGTETRRKAKSLGDVWEPAMVRAKDQGRKPGRNAYRG